MVIRRALAERGLPEWLAVAGRWGGITVLLLAPLCSWFLAPGEGSRGSEPAITWLFRALCVGVAIGGIARPRRALALAGALLLALFLYPTAIVHTSPQLAARVAWLWHQHDELSGYAGDIYTSQESRDAAWQQRILVVDEPIENRIVRSPAWNPANFEWGRLLEVTEWFGLSPWFCQGLARGWVLSIAGATLLLIGSLREKTARGYERDTARSRRCGGAGNDPRVIRSHAGTGQRRGVTLALGASVLMLAAAPFVAGACFLSNARHLVRCGNIAAALTALHRAGAVLPALREDGAYFRQLGRLESMLRRATTAAEFFAAQRLAEDGFAQQSCDAMVALLPALEPDSAGQREVVKRLLSRAIAELNSGQTNPAIARLEAILAVDPCNLKANYVLQIACVRAGRIEELRQLTVRMKETYRFLNTPTKRSVLAAAQEHLAAAELQSGASATALAHWRHAKRLPK